MAAAPATELSLTHTPPKIENDVITGGMALIREALRKAGIGGLFAVRPVQKIRMMGNERFRVKIHRGPFVLIDIKTGNNGTAWQWGVMPPSPMTPENLYKLLKMHAPDVPLDEEPVHITRPRPGLSPLQPRDSNGNGDDHSNGNGQLEAPRVVSQAELAEVSRHQTGKEPPQALEKQDPPPVPLTPEPPPATPATAIPGSPPMPGDVLDLDRLVAQLSAASARAKQYRDRAALLESLKTEIDAQEIKLLRLQEEYEQKTKALNDEFEKKTSQLEKDYEQKKTQHEQLRLAHITDDAGKHAVAFVKTLQTIKQPD